MIDAEKKVYSIALLCEVMRVSRSGYYSWLNREQSPRQQEYERLIPVVQEADRVSKQTYGARRIAKEVEAVGVPCGKTKARTLMKMANVSAKQKKKFKVTTDSKHNMPVAPNLLGRQFKVEEPDKVYVSDLTYLWTQEGWLYLVVIIDLFSRQVVGWSLNKRMTKQLVMNALRMAYWRRKPAAGLLFHSDRGSQYCSTDFQRMLKSYKMVSSMSRKGDCWDNSVAESFFGSLKTERVYFSSYRSRKEARQDVVDYNEIFYNSRRRHSYLGYLSPRQFEEKRLFEKAA
jgi:putative transposase